MGLEVSLSFGEETPCLLEPVVNSRTELESVPLDVESLWIGRFDTSGITDYSFNGFQLLKTLVIGNGIFWEGTRFELNNLPSLLVVVIGHCSFSNAPTLSLTGFIDRVD